MKLATTTGDFKSYYDNDIDKIRALHRAGFKYIDLDMYCFSPNCVYMQNEWKDAVIALKNEADKLGMTFAQAHSQGGNPLDEDASKVDFIVDATIRSIEICSMLGIKNTVVHQGYEEGISKEEWFYKNRDFYKKLFPAMEKFGVNVLIENSTEVNMPSRYFNNTGADMLEFLKFADHPLLHACWDTGHANCEGPQYNEIMTLGKELYAIHYNDNHGKMDEHIMPYFGTLNHDEIIHALIDVGFKGYFTLESCTPLVRTDTVLSQRRPFEKDKRLANPDAFVMDCCETFLYNISKHILSSYGLFEE